MSLVKEKNYQVKSINVSPYCRLSLQSHKFRSEHWVVVKGKAKIVLNDEIRFLETNQSIYIPAGSKHRLENETGGALINRSSNRDISR